MANYAAGRICVTTPPNMLPQAAKSFCWLMLPANSPPSSACRDSAIRSDYYEGDDESYGLVASLKSSLIALTTPTTKSADWTAMRGEAASDTRRWSSTSTRRSGGRHCQQSFKSGSIPWQPRARDFRSFRAVLAAVD